MKKIRFVLLFVSRLLARYFRRALPKSDGKNYAAVGSSRNVRNYLVLVIVLLILSFLAIKFGRNFYPQATVSEGMIGVFTVDNLPPSVTNLLSDPLVKLDGSGALRPDLASSWQVNNDATLYTFKLKSGISWNDGTAVKSSDIHFNLSDVDVNYPDEQTIVFKLADSFAPLPSLLTAPVLKENSLTGTGKYVVSGEDIDRGVVTKLTLAPYKSDNDLPKIIIRFYPDEKTAQTAFEIGEVNSLIGVSADGNDLLNQKMYGVKKIVNFNRLVAVFYNTKDAVLSDKNFRRALGLALTNQDGEGRAKTSIPAWSWAYNDQTRDSVGDKDLAKTDLDKVPAGKDSAITLTTTPMLAKLGEQIVESWRSLGLSAVLRIESGVPQNFQALLISQPIPADPDQYTLWHSTQVQTNISHYSSPRVDKDLEDGRKTVDLDKRKEKYFDFQKVLSDDAPATFLYFPKINVVYQKKAEKSLEQVLKLQMTQS